MNFNIETIAAWLAAAISIIGSLGVIYVRYINPAVGQLISFIKLCTKTVVDASKIHEIIRTELSTDTGWSLKDCLKRIEQKMFIQDNRYRAMLSLWEKPVWEADENGMFIWVNRAFTKILGRDIEDLRNNGWVSILHPDDRERVQAEWTDCVKQNRMFSTNYRMIKTNGEVISCIGEAYPIESINHTGPELSKKGFIGILSTKNVKKILEN